MKRRKAIIIILSAITLIVVTRALNYKGEINSMPEQDLIQELEACDEIGYVLSERILDGRPYESWDDLDRRVEGIGEQRLKVLKQKFTIKGVKD